MPPRPALPIKYQVPTNGANPFGPADIDFDTYLPLQFAKAELRWCKRPPPLQWADEVAPRGAKITCSAVPFFEIETLLLGIVDTTALRTCRVRHRYSLRRHRRLPCLQLHTTARAVQLAYFAM